MPMTLYNAHLQLAKAARDDQQTAASAVNNLTPLSATGCKCPLVTSGVTSTSGYKSKAGDYSRATNMGLRCRS